MENKELVGRKMYGFKGGGYIDEMKRFIGAIGDIMGADSRGVNVMFKKSGDLWWYDVDEAKEHLVTEEEVPVDLNELFKQIYNIKP